MFRYYSAFKTYTSAFFTRSNHLRNIFSINKVKRIRLYKNAPFDAQIDYKQMCFTLLSIAEDAIELLIQTQ